MELATMPNLKGTKLSTQAEVNKFLGTSFLDPIKTSNTLLSIKVTPTSPRSTLWSYEDVKRLILIYDLPKLTTATCSGEITILPGKTDSRATLRTYSIGQWTLRPCVDLQQINSMSSMTGLLSKKHIFSNFRQLIELLLDFLLVFLIQTVGLKSRQINLTGFYGTLQRPMSLCAQ